MKFHPVLMMLQWMWSLCRPEEESKELNWWSNNIPLICYEEPAEGRHKNKKTLNSNHASSGKSGSVKRLKFHYTVQCSTCLSFPLPVAQHPPSLLLPASTHQLSTSSLQCLSSTLPMLIALPIVSFPPYFHYPRSTSPPSALHIFTGIHPPQSSLWFQFSVFPLSTRHLASQPPPSSLFSIALFVVIPMLNLPALFYIF